MQSLPFSFVHIHNKINTTGNSWLFLLLYSFTNTRTNSARKQYPDITCPHFYRWNFWEAWWEDLYGLQLKTKVFNFGQTHNWRREKAAQPYEGYLKMHNFPQLRQILELMNPCCTSALTFKELQALYILAVVSLAFPWPRKVSYSEQTRCKDR